MSSLTRIANNCGCNSHRSSRKSVLRRHPIVSVAGGILTAAAIVGIASMMPDIIRYIKISRM